MIQLAQILVLTAAMMIMFFCAAATYISFCSLYTFKNTYGFQSVSFFSPPSPPPTEFFPDLTAFLHLREDHVTSAPTDNSDTG